MTDRKMRTLELVGGKRTGIRLDPAGWAAVDLVAESLDMKWHEWARLQLAVLPDGENRTAAIREAATAALLDQMALQDRADGHGGLQAAGFRLAQMVYSDSDFDDLIGQAKMIEGSIDLFTVDVMAGIDDCDRVAFYIRNKLQDAPHMVISAPITPMAWLDAMEGGAQ